MKPIESVWPKAVGKDKLNGIVSALSSPPEARARLEADGPIIST